MKVLVIGFGKMGMVHAATLPFVPGIEEVLICESAPFVADGIRTFNPAQKIYKDYQTPLRNKEFSMAVIATPTPTHQAIFKDLVQNGISVFVEKPFMGSLQEALEAHQWYVSRAPRSCKVMVGYCLRFLSTFQYAKKALEQNALGRILHFEAKTHASSVTSTGVGWRFERSASGGGATLELGSHLVDLVRDLFGMPQKISAVTSKWVSKNVEDYCHAILQYGQFLGTVEVCWSMPNNRKPNTEIVVYGTNGKMVITNDFVQMFLEEVIKGYVQGPQIKYAVQMEGQVPYNLGGAFLTCQLIEFVGAVKNNGTHRNTLEESVETHSLLDSMLVSGGENVVPRKAK